ncbi:MAG TPA: DNA mismatch repair protein MutS, partial [Caulobacterales bacterium]|nr:DNA mismatch repair protein MutS [Caulobacterales bacterium]
LAAKAEYPDALLFFRMGDFYELFFEDAEKAAAALGITLTKRGQHKGDPIKMAGVPVHAVDGYLARLIRAGFRVAVCEQLEDPAEARKRGSKSIVKRAVVRIVTPGTLTEDSLLDARAANRLAAVALAGDEAALAWADISTGACGVTPFAFARLADEIAALAPAELLVSEDEAARLSAPAAACGAALTTRPRQKADARAGARRAKALFEVAALDAFGDFSDVELSAIGLLLDYIELTQAGLAPRLEPPKRQAASAFMAIDPATRASLELDRSQRGGREGSLIAAIDRTVTSAGGRLLAERIARPLTDVSEIAARHESIAYFVREPGRREAVRTELRGAGDLARALQRLTLGRGGPRDLAAIRDGLAAGARAAARCGVNADLSHELLRCSEALTLSAHPALGALAAELEKALAAELSLFARDGAFIATGFDPGLDQIRALRDDSRQVIVRLQTKYQEETGQAGLKIRHNAVLGYHIDATPKQAEALMRPPLSGNFIHRQTLAGAVRFTTGELAELDARIARAGAEALARELDLFRRFCEQVAQAETEIRAAAAALAALDVAAGGAEWAVETDAVRPEMDSSRALITEGGRHPVVEQAVRRAGGVYTPNDARLDGAGEIGPRLLFVTGPNMAGKSTYLRQNALLAIIAQAGLFVPAKRMRLGVADRVFSRVGASDDLSRGRSTFMTEMVETAAILHQAGARALVILDEIGRGTATFDGLAIAWAAAEHLHDVNGCRAMFATHYHEITALADKLSAAANANLRAREWKGDLVFLHEVAPGAADRSYGIQVARLAGLPRATVDRARAVLARLEAGRGKTGLADEQVGALPLFAAAGAPSAVEEALAGIDPEALSPREALELIFRLKALLAGGGTA